MRTVLAAHLGRLIGAAAMAALLLGGLTAGAADAKTRAEQISAANEFVLFCYQQGGEPRTDVDETQVVVICKFPGYYIYCDFAKAVPCWSTLGPAPSGPNHGVGGPTPGGVIDGRAATVDHADTAAAARPGADGNRGRADRRHQHGHRRDGTADQRHTGDARQR
jgi:putative hemolysin